MGISVYDSKGQIKSTRVQFRTYVMMYIHCSRNIAYG